MEWVSSCVLGGKKRLPILYLEPHLSVPVDRRHVQGRPSQLVPGVDVHRAGGQELLHLVQVAPPDGLHQPVLLPPRGAVGEAEAQAQHPSSGEEWPRIDAVV